MKPDPDAAPSSPELPDEAPTGRPRVGRALVLVVVCAVAAVALSSDRLHALLLEALALVEPIIAAHPRLGAAVFVLASAAAAMLAFFSSAVLVPVAVLTWDRWFTILLLWLGWLLGGMVAYGAGRLLRRPLIQTRATSRLLAFYQQRIAADVGLPMVLLIQFALPSELPGYLFGLLRVRFRTYLVALALVELPFAVGTVLVGESILQQQGGWLLALGAAGAAILLIAAQLLRHRLRPPPT